MAEKTLAPELKAIVDLPESTSQASITPAILEDTLALLKYDDGGVVKYKSKINETEAAAIADQVENSTFYHLMDRQERMDDATKASVKKVGPSGKSWASIVADHYFGIDKKAMLDHLTKEGKKDALGAVMGLAQGLTKNYGQVTTTDALRAEFPDTPAIRAGVGSLDDFLGGGNVSTPLDQLGYQEAMGEFGTLLGKAREKIYKTD